MLPLIHVQNSIVGTGPDIKVTTGSICLILYCFLPGRNFPVRLVASDYAAIGLFCTHFLSDLKNDGWNWTIPLRAYAEWYLPYVAGRVALQSRATIIQLWPYWASAGIFLSVLSVIEATTHYNIFELFFGIRPFEGGHDYRRWGMRRAYGPTMNPIYFGMVQVLFLGWVVFASILAIRRRCSAWWALAPLPILVGIIGTGSRGPILAFMLVFPALVYFLIPQSRIWWTVSTVVAIVLSVVFAEKLIQTLERWSGEDRGRSEITIDGETRVFSNVRARLLLFEVNKIAFQRSGLLGFGTTATSGFPLNIPVGPMEAKTLRRAWTVENTYALMMLRFGYVGVGCLLALGVTSLLQLHKITDSYQGKSLQWFCAAIGATTFAVMIGQLTVWMPHEIGFPLIWMFGVSAGLTYSHRSNQLFIEDDHG
jgi:hypothetical protein